VVVATHNRGKLAEFQRLLAGVPVELLTLDDVGVAAELPEPGTTYEENARAKAEAARDLTGLPALADDSGIEAIGLGGWPGPHSARWLGEGAGDRDRLLGLLDEVARRSPDDRRARYVAAVALARPGADTEVAAGECSGVLVTPRGQGGFGYDPAFLSDDLGVTFGEAPAEAKDGVSHRARALRKLRI
jgi:XTP/dITP diphosphohydrolase